MKWSMRAEVAKVGISAEAQRNEPGGNAIDNCGPACVACLLMLHGYGDIEPQDLVGQNYRGGTTGPQLNAIIAKDYPNPPAMAWLPSVSDPIGSLADWASKRWLSMGLFYCDPAAVIKPYPTDILHWAMPVEDDGGGVTVWNPEWATFDRFIYADFLKASIHQFDVCQRAIAQETEVWTQGQKRAFAFDGFVTLFGRNPSSEAELDAIANVIENDGSNAYNVRVSMWNDPRAVAYRAKQAGGGTLPAHEHSFSVTGRTTG